MSSLFPPYHRPAPQAIVTRQIREALAQRLQDYRQPEFLLHPAIHVHIHDNRPKPGNVMVEIIPAGAKTAQKPASYMTDYLAMTRVLGELHGASTGLGAIKIGKPKTLLSETDKTAAYGANGRTITFSSLLDLGRTVKKLGLDINLDPIRAKTI